MLFPPANIDTRENETKKEKKKKKKMRQSQLGFFSLKSENLCAYIDNYSKKRRS